MNCARRICVYALTGLLPAFYGCPAMAADNTTSLTTTTTVKEGFQWHDHTHLSWDDFKGEVKATHEESAAATCCSIGFKTNITPAGKPEIIVYNTFYINRSWVRSDAKVQSILDHEQGHFDLCEIYTRKLKERVNNFDLTQPNAKQQLMSIYAAVSQEYETRQQAYEEETTHGTNLTVQKKWQNVIAGELM